MRYILMALVLFCGAVFAKQNEEFKQNNKRYVQPNQIAIEENNIFVQLDNKWFPTESLHVDANGLFVTNDERETDPLHWYCPHCNYKNDFRANKCMRCGYQN